MSTLLTRDQFRERVFERDGHLCVFCKAPAVDAHHIIERRLFPDSGYYIDNGCSVCEKHHLECERTLITVEEVRHACGITKIVLPPHMYSDQIYDKWGNSIFSDNRRARGELFYDQSVQKVLREGGALNSFSPYVKHPRTYHLPWSDGLTDDDRMMPSTEQFIGKRVIVTEKMDGENTSLYTTYTHARSLDSRGHPSRSWVKQFWSTISHNIPPLWRICGENLYATHSLHYTDLPSYFMGFSIWDEWNRCLSWDNTLEWFELIGITPVPVLYDGIYDERKIRAVYTKDKWDTSEGYVVRLADGFAFKDYKVSVGKYVRADHIKTAKHWMLGQPIVPNELKGTK